MSDITGILKSETISAQLQDNNAIINSSTKNKNTLTSNFKDNAENEYELKNSDSIDVNFENKKNIEGQLNDSGFSTAQQYIHIRFSVELPTSDEEVLSETNDDIQYLGICITTTIVAPSSYTSYKWIKIKGNTGEQGAEGVPGADGDTIITIVNPLYLIGQLKATDWITVSNNSIRSLGYHYFYQKINVLNEQIKATTLVDDNLVNLTVEQVTTYLLSKMGKNMSYLVDLIVSDNIKNGILENNQWNYISRTYMQSEVEDDKENIYLYFECYENCPTIDLNYQLKVI